jgi:hypothetical protein
MSTYAASPLVVLARLFHGTGCLLGTAGVLLFTVFAIGEGLPPIADTNGSFAAPGVMLAGFLLAWWNDLVGGGMSLVGVAWFEALEIASNG